MIVLLRKNNVALIVLIFLLSIAVYSLNLKSDTISATNGPEGQRFIILDPGHGGEDPGAVSEYSGIKEKDINLSIAFKVKELLEKENYKILLTRSEDRLEYQGTTSETQMRKQDLNRRKKLMDEAGANLVVSIHLNKFPQTQYWGAQVFYPHNSPESQKLANYLQASIKEIADPNNKRVALVKGKANELPIIILRDLKTTTAIVECGFLSNPEEEKKLATKEYQDKLAESIADGIKKYFEKK
ncbi:MAG: N-acetylmuramoyl-L-alanine amidase [Clostridia bacterium]|nr:N-acetylmuramoyl-L-alanine amidase [Clostridia bacterium]